MWESWQPGHKLGFKNWIRVLLDYVELSFFVWFNNGSLECLSILLLDHSLCSMVHFLVCRVILFILIEDNFMLISNLILFLLQLWLFKLDMLVILIRRKEQAKVFPGQHNCQTNQKVANPFYNRFKNNTKWYQSIKNIYVL